MAAVDAKMVEQRYMVGGVGIPTVLRSDGGVGPTTGIALVLCAGSVPLQLRHPVAGAVFILLRRAAAYTAGSLDDAITQDWHGALSHDHVTA
jgi:hypothetical protein